MYELSGNKSSPFEIFVDLIEKSLSSWQVWFQVCVDSNSALTWTPKPRQLDYALVIDFDDDVAWRAYREHPRHVAFAQRFMPIIGKVERAQYEV